MRRPKKLSPVRVLNYFDSICTYKFQVIEGLHVDI